MRSSPPKRKKRLTASAQAFCQLHCPLAYRRCWLDMEIEECPLRRVLESELPRNVDITLFREVATDEGDV